MDEKGLQVKGFDQTVLYIYISLLKSGMFKEHRNKEEALMIEKYQSIKMTNYTQFLLEYIKHHDVKIITKRHAVPVDTHKTTRC